MNVSLILFHCSAQYNYKGKALNVFSHKNGTNWTFTLIALFDNVEHFTDPLPPLFRLIHLGQVIGTDELKLMKREWSPAFSITTGWVLSWFGVGRRCLLPGYWPIPVQRSRCYIGQHAWPSGDPKLAPDRSSHT